MSREPVLNTILPPLPKINKITPLDLRSKSFDSFPPLPTPKLQPLNIDRVAYLGFEGFTTIPTTKETPNKKVKINKVIKNKKIIVPTRPNINKTIIKKKPKRKSLVYFILLFMTSLFLVTIINTILIRLFVNQ
jgi:hypothetical protein